MIDNGKFSPTEFSSHHFSNHYFYVFTFEYHLDSESKNRFSVKKIGNTET